MNTPDFSYELSLSNKFQLVIGVDEVGRGAFAGPVVVCACALKPHFFTDQKAIVEILSLGIDDSKRLPAYKRANLVRFIQKYFYYELGEIGVNKINKLGILKSTHIAARQAIRKLLNKIEYKNCFLLCDAFPIPRVRNISQKRQLPIIKGDQKCISIAAASIVAKVYRDKLMKKLGRFYQKYRWGRNKGYGTTFHRDSIKRFGVTSLHRTRYVETWLTHSVSY